MTVNRSRIREGFSAGGAYALVAYALAACALLLFLLLSQADAKPVTYANGANSFTDLVAAAAIPEPTLLALLGTGLLSVHLALRRKRRGRARSSVSVRPMSGSLSGRGVLSHWRM
jgi:hypothetical protein